MRVCLTLPLSPMSSEQTTPYIGVIIAGVVSGQPDPLRNGDHKVKGGRLTPFDRWRYEPVNRTVYWSEDGVSDESKFTLENWLFRRGLQVQRHDSLYNYRKAICSVS